MQSFSAWSFFAAKFHAFQTSVINHRLSVFLTEDEKYKINADLMSESYYEKAVVKMAMDKYNLSRKYFPLIFSLPSARYKDRYRKSVILFRKFDNNNYILFMKKD